MSELKNTWPKHISVDKRIVKILSEATYDYFPSALKEIVTNSYDADASQVKIKVNVGREQVIVEDNGKGMAESEFELFLRIAGVKREKSDGTTASGRSIIGKFGVGFLSIFPFFKNYEIETSKKGSQEVLHASIPSYQYFSAGRFAEVSEIPIQGSVRIEKEKASLSFTKITLTGFTPIGKAFFREGKSTKHRRDSVLSRDSIGKLIWKLEEDLPIEYEDQRFNVLTKFYSKNLKFDVFVNDQKLYRRTYADQILETSGDSLSFDRIYGSEKLKVNSDRIISKGKIKFQYFILTNKTAIHPYEARGLKIRNLSKVADHAFNG
jgi:hypothetical protein